MSKGTIREKNANMAAYLKKIGHKRTSAACPACHKVISLNALQTHIASACRSN